MTFFIALTPLYTWWIAQAPLLSLGLIVVVFVELLLYRYPQWILVVLAFSFMFGELNIQLSFAFLNLYDAVSLCCIPVWGLRRLRNWHEGQWPRAAWLSVFYLILLMLGAIWGLNPHKGIPSAIRYEMYFFNLFMICDLLRTLSHFKTMLYGIAFGAACHALYGVTLGPWEGGRMYGLPGQPNELGLYLTFGALAMLGLGLLEKKKIRFFWYVCALFTAASLVMTGSRGSMIAFVVAFIWMMRRYKKMLFIALCFGAMLLPQSGLMSRIESRMTLDESVAERWIILQNSIEMFKAHPAFGSGFGQFVAGYQEMDDVKAKGKPSHCYYIGNAATVGLIPFSFLVLFVFVQLREIRRSFAKLAKQEGDFQLRITVNCFLAIFVGLLVALWTRGGAERLSTVSLACVCALPALLSDQKRPLCAS